MFATGDNVEKSGTGMARLQKDFLVIGAGPGSGLVVALELPI